MKALQNPIAGAPLRIAVRSFPGDSQKTGFPQSITCLRKDSSI